ncbi:MAG: hypothetical protein OEU54_11635 [Gemmatimonadota bacterium]|nr:hypothetical protein [Gemmatimonadota bacterium]
MFVPIPIQQQQQASPRARELSTKIHETIEEFERHYPGTTRSDIQQALQILDGGTSVQRRSAGVMAGSLIALLLGLVVAFRFTGGSMPGGGESPATMIWLVGGLAIVLGIVAVVRARG